MKTNLVLLFTAVLALTSLSSCVDPYCGIGDGFGYGRSSYHRPSCGSYGYSRYSSGYRGPSYGGSCGYSGHHGGYGGHPGGFGGWGGFGGHHGSGHHH